MASLGGDPQDRYFAEGVTDELISTLSGVAGLRVIARSSVIGYADSKKPVSDIARELGVGSVLESTVQKVGNRFRVNVRLIDAATQDARWSDERMADVNDLFALQREISTSVASALRVRLLPRKRGASTDSDEHPMRTSCTSGPAFSPTIVTTRLGFAPL
jgi:TolB-like protein